MNTPETQSGGSLKPVGWAVPTINEMEEAMRDDYDDDEDDEDAREP